MSMDKRECLLFADPGLPFDAGNGLLHTTQFEYVVRSAIKNIAGRRTLLLFFYRRTEAADGNTTPEYTLFQCKDDYITLRQSDGKTVWHTACLDNLGSRYSYITKHSVFYRQRDEQTVNRFCENSDTETNGFKAIGILQSRIMDGRLRERVINRERKIENLMKTVAPVPRDLRSWIFREALPHYIFYDYSRSKETSGYCTACQQDVIVSGAKHNAAGQCPRCGESVTFKSSGKAKRIFDRVTAQVLQRVGDNELVLRVFKAHNSLRDSRKPDFQFHENARFFIRISDANEMEIEPFYFKYGSCLLTNWKKGHRPRFSYWQYNFECDMAGHLYGKNLDDVLPGTPWQYSQLAQFYNIEREPMEVLPYLDAYLEEPAIEYLVKLGFSKLAGAVIYGNKEGVINKGGKNACEALGIRSEDMPVLQRINVDTKQLELYHELRKTCHSIDETLLVWYRDRDISSKDDVLRPLAYTTPHKLMRYADEQFDLLKNIKTQYSGSRYGNPGRILSDFKDYLNMGAKLGYDFTDEFVLFPKNLKDAHDLASKLYDSKKDAIFNAHIQQAYTNLLDQYRFTHKGLTLIPPKTAKEIVTEGHTLHHCVHSYVEQVADGKCVILFVRRTGKVKEPYYTVELKDNQIKQVHGLRHCAPTPEIKRFLDLWTRRKLQAVNA